MSVRASRCGPCLKLVFLGMLGTACSLAQTSDWFTPQQFGAVADFHEVSGVRTIAGEAQVHAPAGTFLPGDVGKLLFLFGAGSVGAHQAIVSTVQSVAEEGRTAMLQHPAEASVEAAGGGLGTDNAQALQACWDASSTRGKPCSMAGGRYLFSATSLRVRRHMRVQGNAPEQTSLVCSPARRDCVVLDDGPVQFVTLDGWELAGTEGALAPPSTNDEAQRGFMLRARGAGLAGGGLWQSSFRHLQVAGFWGDELALIGGSGDTQHPNQFLFFEDVELQAARGDGVQQPPRDSVRLRLQGQNAQIRFVGGQIHGTIAGQFGVGVVINGAGVVTFDGVTCEWLDRCLTVRTASTISFHRGWIENVKQVVETGPGPVRGVFLNQNYLANSCFDTRDRSGFCFGALNPQSQDLAFSQNQLAWGTPPDQLLRAAPGVSIRASDNDTNGVVNDPSPAMKTVETGSEGRQGRARSGWIAFGASGSMAVSWLPRPFPDGDITASCVTVGGEGELSVVGIDRLSASGLRVKVENRGNGGPQRALIECTGLSASEGRIHR